MTIMRHAPPPQQPLHAGVMTEPAPVIMSIYPQVNNNCIPMSNNFSIYGMNHPQSHYHNVLQPPPAYANGHGAPAILHPPHTHHADASAPLPRHNVPHHLNAPAPYYQPQGGYDTPSMGTTMMRNPHQQHHALSVDSNGNNASHVNFGNDGANQTHQQQQLQHLDGGGGNNQPMMIPPDKRPTTSATTTSASQGGGGNLAHCA